MIYFAPAARGYVETRGGQWKETFVRPLTAPELMEANGKFRDTVDATALEQAQRFVDAFAPMGASTTELDKLIKRYQPRGRKARHEAGKA